jgi:hypothetical protein
MSLFFLITINPQQEIEELLAKLRLKQKEEKQLSDKIRDIDSKIQNVKSKFQKDLERIESERQLIANERINLENKQVLKTPHSSHSHSHSHSHSFVLNRFIESIRRRKIEMEKRRGNINRFRTKTKGSLEQNQNSNR